MRNAYIETLYDLARENRNILALVADNGAIVYDKFRKDFPEQFINFGISEANMVTVSAGLASCGKIPFAYTISCFLTMRAFEQIRNDVCLQKMNVKLVGIGAGFAYSNLGPTHHATKDIAIMRTLPAMTILSPADPLEAREATMAAAMINGPVYLRLSTGGTPSIYESNCKFKLGRGTVLREGKDVAVIATGGIIHEVLKAVDELEKSEITTRLIDIHTIKPLDEDIILKAASEIGAVLTVEEHSVIGGLGSAVAEVIVEKGTQPIRFKNLGLQNTFPEGYGTYDEMKEINGLSKKDIVKAVKELVEQ